MTDVASRYRWVALAFAFLSQLSNTLSTQVAGPLAPLFQPELGLTKAQVGLFSSATFTGSWCVFLIAGSLSDRLGARTMMAVGQVVSGALLLSMAVVGSFAEALAAMFAVGLARGLVNPAASKAVMDWFPPNLRATAMGIKQGGWPMAGIFTASILPAVALAHGWRIAMALVGLLVIAGGIATAVGYREAPRQRIRAQGPAFAEGLREVMSNRYLWIVSFIVLLLSTVQLAGITYLALYFTDVVLVASMPEESARIVAAGAFLALCQMGGVAGRVLWGVVSDRAYHGQRMLVMAMVAGLTALMSVVMAFLSPGYPVWLLSGIVLTFGLTAVGYPGLYHTVVSETARAGQVATAVGLSMTLTQAGTVVGPPLFGFIADVSGSYRMGWLFLAGISVISALVAAVSAGSEKRSLAQ